MGTGMFGFGIKPLKRSEKTRLRKDYEKAHKGEKIKEAKNKWKYYSYW